MDVAPQAQAANAALRFLLSGTFTDFQIRTPGYHFNVHRTIVAGESRYFENVCGGEYKEAQQGYVEWDERPIWIATLILGLYKRSYSYDDYTLISEIMTNAFLASGISSIVMSSDIRSYMPHEVHASMFAMAESYESSHVFNFAAREFAALVDSATSPFTLNALIDATDVVYNRSLTISDKLRAAVVYWAQNSYHELMKIRGFQNLFESTPAFAWDFATRYGRASWLYCSICCTEVLLKNCDCGFRGMCEQKNCAADDFASWTCKGCGTTGQLVRYENVKVGQDKNIGEKAVKETFDSLGEAVVKSPGRKRRSS